jgi:acetyl esterase/lipase
MPSLKARLLNTFLRMTIKRQWREGITIEEVRAHAAKTDARIGKGAPPIATEQVTVNGVPATWFGEPALGAKGTLLYLHGGAFSMHLPQIYARFVGRLSAQTGMRVLLPDYRLAPECRFPSATDDCFAAYRWVVEQGLASGPFVVAGDSAGGNLTAVTLMTARDAGLPLPRCAIMLSPVLDATFSAASIQYNERLDPMFSWVGFQSLTPIYCPEQELTQPLISPLFGNWSGLPPLLFHAGSTEMLLDDSIRGQDRARLAGVHAEIRVWTQLAHVFQVFPGLRESEEAIDEIGRFIDTHCFARG